MTGRRFLQGDEHRLPRHPGRRRRRTAPAWLAVRWIRRHWLGVHTRFRFGRVPGAGRTAPDAGPHDPALDPGPDQVRVRHHTHRTRNWTGTLARRGEPLLDRSEPGRPGRPGRRQPGHRLPRPRTSSEAGAQWSNSPPPNATRTFRWKSRGSGSKGDRTDAVHGDLYGDPDTYRVAGVGTDRCAGTVHAVLVPHVPVPAGDGDHDRRTGDPVRDRLTRTHYPLAISGSFASSSPADTRLWDTSVRTLLNCMHETFEDCPFYEQLQYAMDTRSQALFTLHLSNDDRLVRRAIEDFAASGDPSGLTESRTPSVQTQFIPGFSLFWIFMVADHLDHVGDRAFTARFIGRIDSVLGFFDRSVSAGRVRALPAGRRAPVELRRLDRAVARLPAVSRTLATAGRTPSPPSCTSPRFDPPRPSRRTAAASALQHEYRQRATDLSNRITASTAWDPSTGYFRDSDSGRPESQHAQVWAVLSGSVTGQDAADLLRRAMADESLAVCSYAMSLCLFDALRLAGLDELISWQPWHDMLAVNLTTWAEDTVSNRSDCHAWGSVPLQQFPRYVLGVRPTAPGFDAVTYRPRPQRPAVRRRRGPHPPRPDPGAVGPNPATISDGSRCRLPSTVKVRPGPIGSRRHRTGHRGHQRP